MTTLTWTAQQHHKPRFHEGVNPATARDQDRFCTECGDTLPHDLPSDDPCVIPFECDNCSRTTPHEHWEFATSPERHLFHVLIGGCTAEQARQVIAERLSHGRDGFTINIQEVP